MSRQATRDDEDPASRWWATAISDISPGVIRLRGYPVADLIEDASFAQVVWLLLRGDLPSPAQARLLERALVAGVDHGPQSPAIAIARMAATCGVGINNAMASAVNVLGDVHGGAGQQLMELLARIDADDALDAVRAALADLKARGIHVPGFGHRFHPVDPRRDPLMAAVERAVSDGVVAGRAYRVATEIERQLAPIPMNIDGATAVIFSELGFTPELGRGLFVLSRSVGALAHAWEESGSGLRNKGPIPRTSLPAYTGQPERRVGHGG
ncbi:citryl-CoA lyase [Pseudonocardia adelaidensis]|uniref:citrate synthase (unknown stereospecificity) n=1 Tax=Pseudonocardia adelaidensis TaxID=648754 RepID=A0ABP9NXM0_9PSEU